MDRGANMSLLGDNVTIVATTENKADVTGINDSQVNNLPIATGAGLIETQLGPVIAIIHQAANLGKGKTILSVGQVEDHRHVVDDKSVRVNGKQVIHTIDGYSIPLAVRGGLCYVDMRPPTDDEYLNLPHVELTSDQDWNPSTLDYTHNLLDESIWSGELAHPEPAEPQVITTGYYVRGVVHALQGYPTERDPDRPPNVSGYSTERDPDRPPNATYVYEDDVRCLYSCRGNTDAFCDTPGNCYDAGTTPLCVAASQVNVKEPNFEALCPNFAYAPLDVLQRTWKATTQYARNILQLPMRKHFKSRNPGLNVPRRNEPVATDTVFSDVPAIDSGVTAAQLYVGTESLRCDIYPMPAETNEAFCNTLKDNIRKRGAMDKLLSDRAKNETSRATKKVLRDYIVDDWQSEPHHQHQNPAENMWQTIKSKTNRTMNACGCPASLWLLCITWVVFVLNHLAHPNLGWRTPIEVQTGSTPDISPLLCFHFYEPVYYRVEDNSFPSESNERRGRFVGIAESVGDAMTFKILDDETRKIIYRSSVRSALAPKERNLRLDGHDGEKPTTVHEFVRSSDSSRPLKTFDPAKIQDSVSKEYAEKLQDLIGKTYLREKDDDGSRVRMRIVKLIQEHDDATTEERFKYLVENDDPSKSERIEEIIAYEDIVRFINQEVDRDLTEQTWNFKSITGHQGPLNKHDKAHKGSKYNVKVEWEDGSITYEPLALIAKDDPVSCAIYARDNNLLDVPGWKQFKPIARNQKRLTRMLNQARLKSVRRAPKYKYGVQVPRDYKEAQMLDQRNGNNKWKEATDLEIAQLLDYNTFVDIGFKDTPAGYQKIRCHFIYDIKHDGRHKACFVAGGHLTEVPVESVYSGVVSLRSLRLVIFLSELNGLSLYAADIGNAYLEAKTKEKVCFVANEAFGDLNGHTLIIYKALYGLRSSGQRYHDTFSDTLRDMGFVPTKADPDVWMRRSGDVYEYIAVYVDDLAIAAKQPKSITDSLTDKYNYKLKGVGPIEFHLGMDFGRDPDGVLYFGPRKYIKRMLDAYEKLFGEMPRKYASPLEKNDHPELDTTPLLVDDDVTKYQSMVGAAQWLITLARFDIATAIMTLSSYRVAPREGHLNRMKRVYGYVRHHPNALIRVRTDVPDYSDMEFPEYDWEYTVYGNVEEQIPHDAPEPLGKEVVTSTYLDANLYHDLITGRAATGILHFVNQTPIDWFSKKQATVETATYGSEFISARIGTDQIIDLRTTLRYLGVPVRRRAYMFGDNQSVVTSATIPHSGLNKRHNALSYHRVREAIAAKILAFFHIKGLSNPADILSKHCGGQEIWPHIKAIFYWQGDTRDCETDADYGE